MLRLALALLLVAPPQDVPTFDGSPAPASITRTTLEQLLESPGDYTVESTTVLERVRVEDIRRLDEGVERVAGAWALVVREPATGARTSASLYERRLLVAVLAESIARTVRERRDLRDLDARLRVSVFADDAGDRTLYLAVVSSIEWFDRRGQLVASAW